MKIDPASALARSELGRVAFWQGEFELAETQFDAVLALPGGGSDIRADAWHHKGMIARGARRRRGGRAGLRDGAARPARPRGSAPAVRRGAAPARPRGGSARGARPLRRGGDAREPGAAAAQPADRGAQGRGGTARSSSSCSSSSAGAARPRRHWPSCGATNRTTRPSPSWSAACAMRSSSGSFIVVAAVAAFAATTLAVRAEGAARPLRGGRGGERPRLPALQRPHRKALHPGDHGFGCGALRLRRRRRPRRVPRSRALACRDRPRSRLLPAAGCIGTTARAGSPMSPPRPASVTPATPWGWRPETSTPTGTWTCT